VTSQPPQTEEEVLRRPLLSCIWGVLGFCLFQNPNPFIQIGGLSLLFISGFGLLGVGWQWLQAQRAVRENITAQETLEAKQQTRREHHTQRKNRTQKEREQAQLHKDKEAQQRTAKHQQELEAQREEVAKQSAKTAFHIAETNRLVALSDGERLAEFRRLILQRGTTLLSETEIPQGTLFTFEEANTQGVALWIHQKRRCEYSDLEVLTPYANASAPLRCWIIAFEGFSPEVVTAVRHTPVTLIDPHLLANWALSNL